MAGDYLARGFDEEVCSGMRSRGWLGPREYCGRRHKLSLESRLDLKVYALELSELVVGGRRCVEVLSVCWRLFLCLGIGTSTSPSYVFHGLFGHMFLANLRPK